ncbi:MAG: hypothetical protein P1P90_04940 [Patescibacteria group bacterium]|nr:hypothetical protein [Patescibacteria group bacterium]
MMHANLRYISRAWLDRNGIFEVVITSIGGMEFSHSVFRRSDELSISSTYDGKKKQTTYRPTFKQLLPAHLASDFERCVIFYHDGKGGILGSINFNHWIFDRGSERHVLAVSDDEMVRLYLPPINKHVVPFGTVYVSFCFEWPGIEMKATKYNLIVRIKKDLRIYSRSKDWPVMRKREAS